MRSRFFSALCAAAFLQIVAGCSGHRVTALNTAAAVSKEAAKADYDLPTVGALAEGFALGDFSAKRTKKYSDAELAQLYDALSTVTFYFPEHAAHVAMQERVFGEKSARGVASESDTKDMYRTYLGARMFTEAAALKKRFPDMKFYSMPENIVSVLPSGVSSWRVYGVPDEGKTIELKALKLGEGPKIAMLMLPGCEISESAMREILEDPGLGPVFRERGVVLTNRVNAESVALWKKHFNFPEVYLTYKASDFPGFDFDSSPNFYFLKDGRIMGSFTGWSNRNKPDYGKNEMVKGLSAISLQVPKPNK